MVELNLDFKKIKINSEKTKMFKFISILDYK